MTKEVKKVLIIPPQFFPIPAVKGGAVENLITNLITENEIHSDVFFYVISRFDEEAAKYSYKNSKILYLDNKSSSASFKLRHFLRKIIFNRFTKKIFRNSKFGFNELTYFAYRCDKIAKKIKPDIIVSESYDQVHRLWPLVKRFGNENFYYHLHYVRENEPNTRKLVPNTIAISKYVLNHWVNNDQIKGRELVLYNGIDLEAFEHKSGKNKSPELKNSLGIANDDFVVLFVGRLRPHKGVLELLKAFSLIGDKKIKLLLAGDFLSESKEHKGLDESKFEQDCLSLINANKNIIRVGNISYDKIPDYYSISDVQCIPSMWEEGAGLVAIEGMTSGLPLIITDSGGMPEYTGNKCAIIVRRDNDLEKNIASSIELLKNNSDMCGRMSQIGKERARQFSKQNYYRNYIDFLLKKEKKTNE